MRIIEADADAALAVDCDAVGVVDVHEAAIDFELHLSGFSE